MQIVEILRENIIADAFEKRHLTDGVLAERLIRERHNAADLIEKLAEALDFYVSRDVALYYLDKGLPTAADDEVRLLAAKEALELARKA
jgi:hypothetical protein